jgi:hypothetical protein
LLGLSDLVPDLVGQPNQKPCEPILRWWHSRSVSGSHRHMSAR